MLLIYFQVMGLVFLEKKIWDFSLLTNCPDILQNSSTIPAIAWALAEFA